MNSLLNSKAAKSLATSLVAASAMCFPAEALATATVWKGSDISTVAGTNTDVYLYNVKEGKFLGKGGKWGTQAIMAEVGLPFTVTKSGNAYILTSHASAQGDASSYGVLGFTNGGNAKDDTYRFFTDRNSNTDAAYGTNVLTFTETTASDDNKGVGEKFYTISLNSTSGSSSDLIGTFYMAAGTDTEFYNTDAPMGTKTLTSDDSGVWQVVTLNDRRDAFTSTEVSGIGQVPATFLIHDQDFSRNQSTISYWKDADYSTPLTNGTTDCYPYQAYPVKSTTYTYTYRVANTTQTHSATYTSAGGGKTATKDHSFTVNETYTVTSATPPSEIAKTIDVEVACGGDSYSFWEWMVWVMSHSSENVKVTYTLDESATIINTTTEKEGYTYYVGNGYPDSNVTYDKEKDETISETNLQKDYGHKWTANIHGANGNVAQSVESKNMVREGWYEISCQAFTTARQGTVQLFASAGGSTSGTGFYTTAIKQGEEMSVAEDDKTSNTYVMAYDKLHDDEAAHTYKLLVKVGKTGDDVQSLSFGVQVIGAEDTAWTCFDNFTLTYLGNSQFNLYLDETNEEISQIQNQAKAYDADSKEYTGNRTLYLNRQFNLGKWNTIVLPVSLTAEQVLSGFGADVQLSEFYGAYNSERPNTIYFEGVDLSDKKAVAMKAGNLYLIKPTSDMKKDKTYSIDVITGTEGTTTKTESKEISQAYIINQVDVKFDSDIKASVETDAQKSQSEQYGDTENMVKFVGTYVAGTNNIPANSYVLAGNTASNHEAGKWYFRTTTTTSKGFRGWLETYKNQGNVKLTYCINGVEETAEGATNSIAEAFAGEEKAVSGNIYSISGQLVRQNATSVEGLPAGIYVNNGMKIVVK